MTDKIVSYYAHIFSTLKQDKSKGAAPHKPILLLSIIQEYKCGRIIGNKIFITPELTNTFSEVWNQLVLTGHQKRFALPFSHMRNEKGAWWKLVANPGCELWIENADSMRSFNNLTAAVAYARLDENLAALLQDEATRIFFQELILRTYFPGQSYSFSDSSNGYISDLENEILQESPAEYKLKITGLKQKADPETYQIEIYNLGTVFRREIIKIYLEACCISQLRVSATSTITMVDACHIKPFATSFDNTLNNGIALCPNLHRAFDRGIIAIDDSYRVLLSTTFKENTNSIYSLHQVQGIELAKPNNLRFLPSLEAFAWHRSNIFRK